MQSSMVKCDKDHDIRRRIGTLVLGLGLLALCGCASFWDDVTSRDFKVKNLFVKPDPLVTLRDSSDGARRGQALATLREPLQYGGNQEQQDFYVDLLTKSANTDTEPLCRLGAIRALGTYKDPRAVKALEDVYLQNLPFTPEINSVMRMQALASLEKTGNPESLKLFVRVAASPGGAVDSSLVDRQQTNDERLTALRALARFNSADSVEVLVKVLESEKDIALRDRAHQSLVTITGKRLPPEATAWRDLMQKNRGDVFAHEAPGIFDKMLRLTGY